MTLFPTGAADILWQRQNQAALVTAFDNVQCTMTAALQNILGSVSLLSTPTCDDSWVSGYQEKCYNCTTVLLPSPDWSTLWTVLLPVVDAVFAMGVKPLLMHMHCSAIYKCSSLAGGWHPLSKTTSWTVLWWRWQHRGIFSFFISNAVHGSSVHIRVYVTPMRILMS